MKYAIAALWIACGIWDYGATEATFDREFSSMGQRQVREDRAVCFVVGLFGPYALPASFMITGAYQDGWKL